MRACSVRRLLIFDTSSARMARPKDKNYKRGSKMANDRMYDLAFQYKATKLWKQMYDDEIFAVKLSDGEIGYCNVMGMRGEHIALSLYVGAKGWLSFNKLANSLLHETDKTAMSELLTSQDCLQCSFECKDMLSAQELKEVHQYAQAHEKNLRGRNAFPQFTKYRPGRYPWHYDLEIDEQRICDALSAAIALKKLLRSYSKEEVGLLPLRSVCSKLPMLSLNGEKWTVSFTKLPEATEEYPAPVLKNNILGAKLKKSIKKGTWECGALYLPKPVQDEGKEEIAPYFPLVLLAVDRQSGYVMPPVICADEDAEEMISKFAEDLLTDTCPKYIFAGDERCFFLLRDLCLKAGIVITRENDLKLLEEAKRDLLDNMTENEEAEGGGFDREQLDKLCDTLMLMRDGELKQMPPSMISMLFDMMDWGVIPDELATRLRKLFRK